MRISYLILLSLFIGCATKPSFHGDPHEKHSQISAEETVEKQIASLVKSAESSGPYALGYLTNDLYLKASASAKEGDSQTAAFLYDNLLKIHPDDILVRKNYAIELIKLGKIEEGEKILVSLYNEFKELGPTPLDERVSFILGGLYITKEEKTKAREVYRRMLKRYPQNADACVFYAKSYRDENKFKQAIETLRSCAAKDKDSPQYHYYIGKFYLEQDKYSKAIKNFKQSLKIYPEYYQSALGIGLIYEEQKKLSLAVKTYEDYIAYDSGNTLIMSRLVNLLFGEGKFKKVIPYAEMLTNLDPDDLNLKVKLGILLSDDKQYGRAVTIFEDLHSKLPDSDRIIFYLGSLYKEMNELDLAVGALQKISVQSSLFMETNLILADILKDLALMNTTDNEGRFLKFTSTKSDYWEQLQIPYAMTRASYYESLGKINSAISELEDASSAKEFGEGQNYYLALLYDKHGDFLKAREVMALVVDANPQNAHALNFLGYSYLEKSQDLDKAYTYITRALTLLPEDGFILDSMGWYYFKVGNIQKAFENIQAAYQKVPKDMEITKHLGVIYKAMQKPKLAQKYFNEAVSYAEEQNQRQEIAELIKSLEVQRIPASK